jgi:hypothetical protein
MVSDGDAMAATNGESGVARGKIPALNAAKSFRD